MIAESDRWTIDDRTFDLLRGLIKERTGIALKETKRPLLVSRLGRRLRELDLDSFLSYYELLTKRDAGGQELRRMINCITTNKTSFFREEAHFHFLADHLRARAAAARSPQRFRIWCAASSTGEEPYSLAVTVLEAVGAAGWDVKILASDIDTDVLATAAAGVSTRPSPSARHSRVRASGSLRHPASGILAARSRRAPHRRCRPTPSLN